MADGLMPARAVAASAALLLAAGSAAQGPIDPTRPPLELMRATIQDRTTDATKLATQRPRVESILLSSTRKGAIIDGQYVALDGTYGKAKLVRITATEVTLKSDQGLEVLQLYPPLEKTSAASGAGGKSEETIKRP